MPQKSIRIFEIYDSIQGESTLAGMPCTLVRLGGCPLRCTYCDTPQAQPADSGSRHCIDDVVREVNVRARPLTLVTGGEPLAQKSCLDLLAALADTRPLVQLETSGALDISSVDRRIHRILDIKTPGSGEAERNRWNNLEHLHAGDEIKFVLACDDDYPWVLEIMRRHRLVELGLPILLSPAWGLVDAAELASWMLRDRVPARLQLQWHKHIWGAQVQGV